MNRVPETALRARKNYIEGKAVKAILADTDFSPACLSIAISA
jgi:hypothetical protein